MDSIQFNNLLKKSKSVSSNKKINTDYTNHKEVKKEDKKEYIKEVKKEDIKEVKKEDIKEVKKDNIKENKKEDIKENKKEDIKENKKEDIKENKKEDIKKVKKDNIKENKKEDIKENIKDDIEEIIKEEIKQEVQRKPRKTYYVKKIKIPKPPKILKKRGRKAEPKKYEQTEIKPEEVINYIITKYPEMGLDKVKTIIIDELKQIKNNQDVLIKFTHDDTTYYYDTNNDVFNKNGTKIGVMQITETGEKQFMKTYQN